MIHDKTTHGLVTALRVQNDDDRAFQASVDVGVWPRRRRDEMNSALHVRRRVVVHRERAGQCAHVHGELALEPNR